MWQLYLQIYPEILSLPHLKKKCYLCKAINTVCVIYRVQKEKGVKKERLDHQGQLDRLVLKDPQVMMDQRVIQ